ncbi:9420_t:CDS:2 [Acaulospora morrowiae]|uniref:9420_t:CDS:1 n=1 Tax=Acaulospora morrowiae TaxID=94023 RepID=A0A9N9B5V4_9GLOM|nr:9420_t:CDS:2 [Acaulospora morrowiae]
MADEEVCVFMDIDDEWTLQDITLQIEEFRKDKSLEVNYESSSAALSPEASLISRESPSMPYVVVDTNFLISHLAFLKTLIQEYAKKNRLLIIIPWIVLQELDGLKSRPSKSYDFSNGVQPDLQKLAQNAIYFLHNCLVDKVDGIRGQKLDEKMEKHEHNDDKILDCCRYFRAKTLNPIILLSNDKNLCVKAMVHELSTASYKNEGGSDGIIRKIFSLTPYSNKIITKRDDIVTTLPGFHEHISTNRLEHHSNPNLVYKKEPENFIEGTDIIMMDCDDTLQNISSTTQNSEHCVLIQISSTLNDSVPSEVTLGPQFRLQNSEQLYSSSNYHNDLFDSVSSSLYDSIHASSNRKSNVQRDKTNGQYSAGTPNSLTADNSKRGIPPSSSLYASIHAPKNFGSSEISAIGNINKFQEADIVSMMISKIPAIPTGVLSKNIGSCHKQLIDKIMFDLHTFLPPAMLFHFQTNFGQDWTYIINEPQPWSLYTMIKFIDRYWMTVFSDIFQKSRKIQEITISNLLYFIRSYQHRGINGFTIQELQQFIQNSEIVLTMLYDGVEGTWSIFERSKMIRSWWDEFVNSVST